MYKTCVCVCVHTNHNLFQEKGRELKRNRAEVLLFNQPDALPLGQTGRHTDTDAHTHTHTYIHTHTHTHTHTHHTCRGVVHTHTHTHTFTTFVGGLFTHTHTHTFTAGITASLAMSKHVGRIVDTLPGGGPSTAVAVVVGT